MKRSISITVLIVSVLFSASAQNLNKSSICKKWYMSHYEYYWIDFEPEANEKNDYILFNTNLTYESVDEGKKSTGKWSFNAKENNILMYDEKGEHLKLLVKDLDEDKFVFEIDIEEMKGVKIHYSSKKK